jgi:DNA helicase HerA-like ATPase
MLGQLQITESRFAFSVGERAFATLGSKVRIPSDAALAFLCNVGLEDDPTAALLGHLAYGQREFDTVPIRFSVGRLKGKRSFVFARAGYGKSNLIKYLMSQLYSSPPDVGLLIFDPEGEYALPDSQGRPGLVNVPALRNRISLYTNRKVEDQYAGVVKGSVYVDFGDFPPQDIVAGFIAQEKQDSVFANLLRSQDWKQWKQLVDLLAENGFATEDGKIAGLLSYKSRKDDVSLAAIKNNLLPPIRRLHRSGSTLGKNILAELRQNRVVIVDVSLLGSEDSLAITGMLMWRIFQHNVRHMTDVANPTVRCLAVMEEAQTILGERVLDDRNVFVRWVKEGRKYGLGCVLVTQQPSSISGQIISQGDNFFVLHLLNDGDLQTLKRHNAYYSDEILGFIRGEPIPGNCYFWSAPSQPFVLPVRVRNFEVVCVHSAEPASVAANAVGPDSILASDMVSMAVTEAIRSAQRVWVYPVSSLYGKREEGLVTFSFDYLLDAVAERISQDSSAKRLSQVPEAFKAHLSAQIDAVLKGQNGRSGYAVLQGVTRAVWVLPAADVKLDGKPLRSQAVEVVEKI